MSAVAEELISSVDKPYDPTGDLAGIARPTAHMRVPLQILHGVGSRIPLLQALEDAQAIEAMAGVLEDSAEKSGGVFVVKPDFRCQAAHILKALRGG